MSAKVSTKRPTSRNVPHSDHWLPKVYDAPDGKRYVDHTERDQFTEEVQGYVLDVESGWFNDKRIIWEDFWDRLDGTQMNDGTYMSIPEVDMDFNRAVKRFIAAERRKG